MAVFLSRSCGLCRLGSKQPRTILICLQWFCTMALGAGPGFAITAQEYTFYHLPGWPELGSQAHPNVME